MFPEKVTKTPADREAKVSGAEQPEQISLPFNARKLVLTMFPSIESQEGGSKKNAKQPKSGGD